MPLTRYLIRNEYGLADPELYTDADKDDPEALLEGVAMAGLVGALRQLGDLAEFAAEIFHNLHEEVMATAARGHSLMVRVQQLEAEFPSIEKVFLSQTNNTSFLFNAEAGKFPAIANVSIACICYASAKAKYLDREDKWGIDWHPNLHSEQNIISSGDLPRFVMDSYEDCRGPPRLFLLDKFDVAGAGACLKRYSDPSFFLVDSISSNTETQRETKLRKVKKKGSRWKNGETPDNGPASHVKLQQLLMEERIENGYTNPARFVKLKKRQMRNCGVDLKTGKSYMEKFLETPSPEQKMVCGSSVTPPCLELTSDDIGESGFKMLEISTASDVMKSPGKESASSSCNTQESMKQSMGNGITDREIVKVIEAIPDNEREGGYPMSYDMGIENEAVDGESNPESSMDGYLSDDLISEVDNYMDALNTLESELETDNECKSRQVGEDITGSDVNEEHLGIEPQFLDPQSIGNSSESNDGNISFLQGNSRPYWFNAVTVDKLSHDSGPPELFNSTPETQNLFTADIPFNLIYSQDNIVKELGISSNSDEEKVPDCELVCSNSCFSANPSLPCTNLGSSIPMALMVESAFDKTADHVGKDSKTFLTGADFDKLIAALSDDTSPTSDDSYQYATAQSKRDPVNESYGGDSTVNSDILLHSQNALDLVAENDPAKKVEDKILQVDYQDKNSFGSIVDDTLSLTISSTDKLLLTSPKVELLSVNELSESLTILRDFSSDAKYNDPTSMVDNLKKETEVSQEELVFVADSPRTESLSKEQVSNAPDDVPRPEAALVELNVICSEEIKEVMSTDINKFISNVDCVGSDTPLDELQSEFPMNLSHVHENSDCYVTETIGEGSECNFSTSAYTNIDLPSSGQLVYENDENFANVVTEAVKTEDVCDSAVDVTKTAFQAVIFELPSTNTDYRCHQDPVDLDDVPTQAFCENVIVPAATFPDTQGFDGVDEEIHLCLDLMSSPRITEVWEQNQSGVGNQQQIQEAINEAVCGGSDVDPEIKEKENESEVLSLLNADCKPVFLDSSNLEPDDICSVYGLVQTDQNQDSLTIDATCLPPASLELTNLQLQETSTNIEDLSPPCCLPVLQSPVGPFTEVQPNQLQMEHLEAVAATSNSSNLHESEIIQSHIGRPKCEQLQSSTPGNEERLSDKSPKSPPETLEAQSSQSESTQQGSCASLGSGPQWPFKPSFVIVSEGEQVNLEEMPPLPPLPPVQWRLGKIQPAFPASHRKWVETSENQSYSIPPPKMDQTSDELALQSSQGIVHLQNPFLILETEEKSNNILGNTLHESAKSSSLRFPSMFNKLDHQYTSISLDDNQSLNPFVTIPVAYDEKLESFSGQELVHSALVPSQVSRTEGGIVKHGSQSSSTNSLDPQNEFLPEPGLESKMFQQAPQNLGVEEVNPHAKLEAPFIKHEQHQSLLVVEGDGEMGSSSTMLAMVSPFEEGQPNGKLPNKIPHPRSPLIDAVATHDKRLLRKATERVLPLVVPKVDEKDSWLEQIRTKSFNLKPAVVTRPIIQGPKTNLKVAAILQRANAIRQACAGSDEDDDDDSWNDSD